MDETNYSSILADLSNLGTELLAADYIGLAAMPGSMFLGTVGWPCSFVPDFDVEVVFVE